MPQEVEIPGGGGKKLPGWVLLAGGAVVVLILLLKKGGGDTTGEADTSGMLASELDQRLQEMEQAIAQALQDAQGQAPNDQTAPPSEPVSPGFPERFPRTPGDDDIFPGEPGRPPKRTGKPPTPGGYPSTRPPMEIIPSDTRPDRGVTEGGVTIGLPARRTTAPIGTRTGHISRIKFTEEAGEPLKGHRRAQGREETSTILNMQTNITERSTATPSRKAEREKRSPALKSAPRTIKKPAPSSTQKMNKQGPTVRTNRKR